MSLVLLYNISGKKSIDIEMICHKLNLTNKTIEKDEIQEKKSILKEILSKTKSGVSENELNFIFLNINIQINLFLM